MNFGMQECKPASTPMDPALSYSSDGAKGAQVSDKAEVPYREAIGSLLYLSLTTRPDISHAVGVLSRFCESPRLVHWEGIKRIMRYLKGTASYALIYECNKEEPQLSAYCDADHGGCEDTSRSTSGVLLKYGKSCIGWQSKRQSTVAVSTAEAEYVAAYKAAQEVSWYRMFLKGLGVGFTENATILRVDNQSAIKMIKRTTGLNRTKHIRIKYHYVQEKFQDNEITLEYTPSKENQADVLTKQVLKDQYNYLLVKIGLISTSSGSVGV